MILATIRRNPAPPPGRLTPGPTVVSRLRAVATQDHVVDAHIAERTFPEATLTVPAQPDGEPVTHARTNTRPRFPCPRTRASPCPRPRCRGSDPMPPRRAASPQVPALHLVEREIGRPGWDRERASGDDF